MDVKEIKDVRRLFSEQSLMRLRLDRLRRTLRHKKIKDLLL
jgi:hypothetical protein